jgi:CubicO group peptidase (beta-lactamase class C family)
MPPSRWQACLDHLQAEGRLPSIVGGVLLGGELLWSGASGDVAGDDPADVQYRIGSITKTLVAVAVLRCRDDGLLALDDPVGRFVPESGYAHAGIRSLLAHTSGMQSEPVGSWWERSPGVDVRTLLERNDGSGAVAAAGEFHHYSNLGFALLGEAVARIRGASWWEVVATTIMAPLGMTRTTYHPQAPSSQGYSVGHFSGTLTREPHQDTGAMAPAGQVWSTIADLARWGRFLAFGHPEVLDVETLREASHPGPTAPEYGLGLRLVPWHGRHLVGHTGSMPGFLASLFVDPATGDGSVVLTNATTGLDTDGVPALLLGSDGVETRPPWVPTRAVPDEVADLLGVWFWGNTAFELRWHDERLEVHSLALKSREDVFELRDGLIVGAEGYHRGETLHVVRRDDGSISHLDCATFVYTKVPYDPDVPIPGGHPTD